jgi:DNA invertase Pin-like site-specific DNA recombinase
MSNENYTRLSGKRCIGLVRCSTAGQADTSIPDQIAALKQFAEKHGLVIIDIIILEGVSGSVPGNRDDLQQLIERKQRHDDFEVLLVLDTTRLTRSGIDHAGHIHFLFGAEGVEIVYVMAQLPEGPAGDMLKTFQYYSANEQARSISRNTSRGAMSALEDGRLAHARRPPFAVDRLYRGPDGKARHIIRNLPDGTQVKLDPQTREVIERFGRNPKTGKPAHYLKQPDESVELVPGEERACDAARLIFRRSLVDGWGGWRIAKEIDSMGVRTSTGKQWDKQCVKAVLRNSIYLGVGIANRIASGLYYNRSGGGVPSKSKTGLKETAKRKWPKQTLRPREDWIEIDQPAMADFLPEELRAPAAAMQAEYWSRREQGIDMPKRSKHVESLYFLSDLLMSRQGQRLMKGKTCGPKGCKTRYHVVPDAQRYALVANPVWRRMVPAWPVEQLVLRLLQQTLLAAPNLRGVIRQQIQRQYVKPTTNGDNAAALTARRVKLQEQREFVLENPGLLGKDEARQRLTRLNDEMAQIEQQLASADATPMWDEDRVEQTVDELVEQLRQSADVLRAMPKSALQRMLAVLVERLEVDLEKRSVEATFALPQWAVESPGRLAYELCLKKTSAYKRMPEAQTGSGITLLKVRVYWLGDQYIGYGIAA